MSLVLQSSGGGSVTLQEPVTASNLTITVPAVTGTMLTTASAGTVLQVIQGSTSTLVSIASTSFVDVGLSLSITPTSATSKILVLLSQSHLVYRNTGDNIWGKIQIVRNSTNVYTNNQAIGGRAGTAPDGFIVYQSMGCYNYLDSPATTSSITYKVQGGVSTTSNIGTMVCQEGSSISTITLMEIAA